MKGKYISLCLNSDSDFLFHSDSIFRLELTSTPDSDFRIYSTPTSHLFDTDSTAEKKSSSNSDCQLQIYSIQTLKWKKKHLFRFRLRIPEIPQSR